VMCYETGTMKRGIWLFTRLIVLTMTFVMTKRRGSGTPVKTENGIEDVEWRRCKYSSR